MSATHALAGARIRRIDAPSPTLYCLSLSSPSVREVLVVSLSKAAPGLGLIPHRPLGQPASALVRKLRKELEGGVIEDIVRTHDHGVEFHVRRGGQQHTTRFDFERPAEFWATDLDTLRALGPKLLDTAGVAWLQGARLAWLRGVRTARHRLQRRHAAIAEEIARASLAPALRAEGALLLTQLHAIPRGASSAELLDYAQDPPALTAITLDPARGVREQAEARFHKARRFERGASVAAERLTLTEREQAALDRLQVDIEQAADREALDALGKHARALGVRLQQGAPEADGTRKKAEPRLPYRTFKGERDREIRVGRGAAHNDALTLHHARPYDLWLHARDTSGAHVVVPLTRGESCPPGLLRDAALLAAHFSGVRGEPLTDVTYAERRHIRKPRGAAAGSVNVDREKVFRLQLDPERLKRLLSTELPEP
jgi:predicted ribosome quality control (RQC) complex YloA/Tae2 family protein